MANHSTRKGTDMVRRSWFTVTMAALFLLVGTAHGQGTKKKPRKPTAKQPSTISLADMEVGQTGHLTFGEGKGQTTLYPLKSGGIDDDQFIGMTGSRPRVIVRGVKTDGMVSDRYYQLNGPVKVTGTEEISNGSTVFVLEPVDPATFTLVKSMSPDLVIPR